MMKPLAARHYNPDPVYLRAVIKATGLTQKEAAIRLQLAEQTIGRYLADRDAAHHLDIPYTVQYCLEMMAYRRKPVNPAIKHAVVRGNQNHPAPRRRRSRVRGDTSEIVTPAEAGVTISGAASPPAESSSDQPRTQSTQT